MVVLTLAIFYIKYIVVYSMKYEIPNVRLVNGDAMKIVSKAESEDLAEATIDLFELLAINPHNVVNSKDKNITLIKTDPPLAGERDVESELQGIQLLVELDLILKDFNDVTSDIRHKSNKVYNDLIIRSLDRVARGY